MMYSLGALTASALYLAAGWRSRRARDVAATRAWQGVPTDPLWSDSEIDINTPELQADVGAAIRLIMKRLGPAMANQAVQAEIACPSGILVRMTSAALTDLLEELVTAAVHCAPASRLLMTATTHGDRIHISVTDDMPGSDLAFRESSVRGLIERVAMRGLALDINVRPKEGTTMILRLDALPDKDRHLPQATAPSSDSPTALPVPANQ
jgi:hypothetical protein